MTPRLCEYTLGDVLQVNSVHSVGIDRKDVEPNFEIDLSRTIYDEETNEVLACFGIIRFPNRKGGVVWIDFSEKAQKGCPGFLAKTIHRHVHNPRKLFSVDGAPLDMERAFTLIKEDDAKSIEWIEWLGFDRVTGESECPEMDGQVVYQRAC